MVLWGSVRDARVASRRAQRQPLDPIAFENAFGSLQHRRVHRAMMIRLCRLYRGWLAPGANRARRCAWSPSSLLRADIDVVNICLTEMTSNALGNVYTVKIRRVKPCDARTAAVGFSSHSGAVAAMAAFVLGIVQFAAPKGTLPHRIIGWLWGVLILVVSATAFLICGGSWSPIHLRAVFTLLTLPLAVRRARQHGGRAIGGR